VLEGYLLGYGVVALHAVYRSAWWATVLKGLVVGVAYAASLYVTTTWLMPVWALLD
jgi:hypothetical protein